MNVFRFMPPYNGKKTTFPESTNRSGVYIIKKDSQIVYIGFSKSNLYKTMYRHFQKWNDKTQARVVYSKLKDIMVRIIYCTPKQADRLEKFLILKYKPKDNPIKYEDFEADAKETEAGDIYFATPLDNIPF